MRDRVRGLLLAILLKDLTQRVKAKPQAFQAGPGRELRRRRVQLGFFTLFRKTGLDAQTETAAELLRDLGYGNVKRTEVPGMGHEGRPGPVIETFRPYWLKEKRRDEPLG